MSESNVDVARRIFDAADQDQIARIAPQIEAVMRSEPMKTETAAVLVSSMVGWFVSTIDKQFRAQFEQCIEVNFDMVAEEYS